MRHIDIDVGNEAENNDAQRLVVAAAVEDTERALVIREQPRELWRDPHLQDVVEALRQVLHAGGRPSPFSVSEGLRAMGKPTSLQAISSISSGYLAEANFRAAMDLTVNYHGRHQRAIAFMRLADKLSRSSDLAQFDRAAIETFASFAADQKRVTGGSDPDIVEQEIARIEAGTDREGFLSTGIPELDSRTEGFGPGQYICIAAWPGGGKTAFSAQLAAHMAEIEGADVYFEELEMNLREIARRRISAQTGKPLSELTPQDLATALTRCGRSHRLYWESAGGKLEDFLGRVHRRMILYPATKAIFVDYRGLLQGFGRGYDPVSEASAVSDALKNLAQRYQVTVIAMQQPNRSREGRADKRPVVSDLRDSNKIVQDAHKILFLHRPWEHDKTKPKTLVELHVLKDRSGQSGGFLELVWSPSTYRFSTWPKSISKNQPQTSLSQDEARLEGLF